MGGKTYKSLLLISVLFSASMSGCFGENQSNDELEIAGFQIDFTDAADAELRGGEWHTFFLAGKGRAISVPNNVMMFIDDVLHLDMSDFSNRLTQRGNTVPNQYRGYGEVVII